VYEHLGVTSLFSYCVEVLKFGEDRAYALIRGSRKSVEVPELKMAVSHGELSVAAAKRIAVVITPENKSEGIEKAKALKQRELDKAADSFQEKHDQEKRTGPRKESLGNRFQNQSVHLCTLKAGAMPQSAGARFTSSPPKIPRRP
jgi:hypothetical protein